MTDRRPDARPPRVRAAEFAASRWTIASGARLHVHLDDDHARVEIAVLRDALGGPPSFPSLVDHHLVWLILDLAADPDELILTQTLRGFTAITTTYHHPRSDALARHADRIAAADLPIHDRLAIERRLTDLRASLIAAVAEHTCIRTPDDDAQAIDRALQRLHAHTPPAPTATPAPRSRRRTEAPTRAPEPEPAPEPTPALTTLALTPEQRLWLLDLLAGFVEDHDANLDETDPTPTPPNVEWARAVADQLSAEIAALADHPPP